jgi:tubulin beta
MRELINLHVGACGTQMGGGLWNTISNEHGIDEKGIAWTPVCSMLCCLC